VARASSWATNQLYMAHFTVTDVAAGRFYAFERFSRGAAGLAGATAAPFRVWLEDWSAEAAGAMPRMRLRAREGAVALDLVLDPLKPIVLQGDRGYDRKSADPGNASYYYSMTRFATDGVLAVAGQRHAVRGLSWMDREWSTRPLGEDKVGWDWFALHLSDGRDLMYYQLRDRAGQASPFSSGLVVAAGGTARRFAREDVVLEVLETWRSPRSRAVYPSRWRLRVPSDDLDLTLRPAVADQELDVSIRYWEGTVRLEGTAAGRPVTGRGYVELTGYGEADDLRFKMAE
jgi:predicted secreted hydrolase